MRLLRFMRPHPFTQPHPWLWRLDQAMWRSHRLRPTSFLAMTTHMFHRLMWHRLPLATSLSTRWPEDDARSSLTAIDGAGRRSQSLSDVLRSLW